MGKKFVVNVIRQLEVDNKAVYCELVNFLVVADSIESAEQLVEQSIKENEKEFINSESHKGIWKFVEILSTNPIISEVKDVIELQVHVYASVEILHGLEALRVL